MELPHAITPEELQGCAKIPMAPPSSRQPLAFQHSQLPHAGRTESTSPISETAATALTYQDSPVSHLSRLLSPAATFCPLPTAISCVVSSLILLNTIVSLVPWSSWLLTVVSKFVQLPTPILHCHPLHASPPFVVPPWAQTTGLTWPPSKNWNTPISLPTSANFPPDWMP